MNQPAHPLAQGALLLPLTSDDINRALASEVLERVRQRVKEQGAAAEGRHCMRVTTLPEQVMRLVVDDLARRSPEQMEAVLLLGHKQTAEAVWQVSATRLIEQRNADDRRPLVAFIPPGLKAAAEDSFDVSTFVEINMRDIPRKIADRLLSGVDRAAELVRYTATLKPLDDEARLRFALTLRRNKHPKAEFWAWAGAALFELGLIPDFDLFSGDWQQRIQRNLKATQILQESNQTLLGRIYNLKLEADTLQIPLFNFLKEQPIADVRRWGERIATSAQYRMLAYDQWVFIGEVESEEVTIILDDLDLPPHTAQPGMSPHVLYFDVNRAAGFTVKWECDPKPLIAQERGLEYFRVALVDPSGEPVWQSKNIRVGTSNRSARSFKLAKKEISDQIEDGVYFVRVNAYDASGEDITVLEPRDRSQPEGKHLHESEDVYFWFDEQGEPPPAEPLRSTSVSGYAEAQFRAQSAALERGSDPTHVRVQTTRTGWASEKKAKGAASIYNIVYDAQVRYTITMSALLRRLESDHILADPGSLGRWHLDLSSRTPERAVPKLRGEQPDAPRAFLQARARLFSAVQGEDQLGLVAVTDLLMLKSQIIQYCEAYLQWLREVGAEAIDIDVIEIIMPADDKRVTTALIMAPTHPLRLLWHLQRAHLAAHWVSEAIERGTKNRTPSLDKKQLYSDYLFKTLSANNLIPILWLGALPFIESDPLTPLWGVYFAAKERDLLGVRQRLNTLLGVPRQANQPANDEAEALYVLLKRYLELYPYLSTFTVNTFNIGEGAALMEALLKIESWRNDPSDPLSALSYELRLFSHDTAQLSIIGEAIDRLVNPAHQVTDEADSFTVRSANPLFPKLRYSRNTLADYRRAPENYEADVALCHNMFATSVGFASLPAWRSSYVYGLVQEPASWVETAVDEVRYAWHHAVQGSETFSFNRDDHSSSIAVLMREIAKAQVMAAQAPENAHPVITLDLSPADMSLIHQVHSCANWVITLDRHLGPDYFDHAPTHDRPAFLLDHLPSLDHHGGTRLFVSTLSTDSIESKIDFLGEYSVKDRPQLKSVREILFQRLRAIHGRLAYKALVRVTDDKLNKSRAALIALSDIWMESQNPAARALIIPLEAHPQLFGHSESRLIQQSMLLYVQADIEARRLDLHLIGAEWFSDGLSSDERERRIKELKDKFASTADHVGSLFAPDPQVFDYAAACKRLITLLVHYVERARRYNRVTDVQANRLRAFVETLDAKPDLRVNAIALIVDQTKSAVEGRTVVHSELTCYTIRGETAWALAGAGVMPDVPNASTPEAAAHPSQNPADPAAPTPSVPAENGADSRVMSESAGAAHTPPDETLSGFIDAAESSDVAIAPSHGGSVSYDVILGGEAGSPQYGLLGMTPTGRRRISLDLNGTNTICLFGAQGSGKSYTVGSIVEMATQAFPAINSLPAPLGTVIFHYHESRDYPPEYVSMTQPNTAVAEIERLIADYQAQAGRLNDIVLLTPIDKVEERRAEFPGLRVEPIMFASDELSIDSWQFLMGTADNNSAYLKTIKMIMRQIRHKINFETLSEKVEQSSLTPQQRYSARLRLQFARQFIDDEHRLGTLLQPGRMVIVDLRDELIDKSEALGLFVVMLKIFANAGKDAFNKLVVFDEAHKYMNDDDLSDSILSAIRQMRHQGVTLLIASQDPASLPNPIIELASMVVIHRINAPSWLAHMKRSITALKKLDPEKLTALRTGQAYVWAARASDPRWTEEPRLIQMRPRVTEHGGYTRTAL